MLDFTPLAKISKIKAITFDTSIVNLTIISNLAKASTAHVGRVDSLLESRRNCVN